MSERRKRTAPLWLVVVALLAATCSLVYTSYAAIQSFQIQLPYLFELQFIPTKLEVAYDLAVPIEFTYDYATQQYTEAKIQIRNTDTDNSHGGAVEIKLVNSADITVAQGIQNTGLLGAGLTLQITVPLTWQPGYTVADIESVPQPPCQIIPTS